MSAHPKSQFNPKGRRYNWSLERSEPGRWLNTSRMPIHRLASAYLTAGALLVATTSVIAAEVDTAQALKERIERLERIILSMTERQSASAAPGTAGADEVRALKERLESQERIIERLTAQLQELDARLALPPTALLPAPIPSNALQAMRGRGDPSRPVGALAQASGATTAAQPSGSAPRTAPQGQGAPAPAAPAATGQQAPEKKESGEVGDDIRLLARQAAVFDRKLSLELGYSYARYDRRQLALSGFYALDAIFLGTLSVDQLKGNTHNVDLSVRYGLTETIGVDAQLPWTYRGNLYLSGGANNNPGQLTEARVKESAQGDASAGISWQVGREIRAGADVVASLRLRVPTGETPFGIPTRIVADVNGELTSLKVPTRLPTGNGFYTFQPGISILKTYDPIVLFANASYSISPSRHFDDISAGSGVPGSVKLGNTTTIGFGMILAMNDTSAFSVGYTMLTTRGTKTRVDGQDWVRVVGSEGNAAILSLGVTHALTPKLSMVTSLGVGLTNDSPNYTFGIRFPYRF
jgi:hypothetical protein